MKLKIYNSNYEENPHYEVVTIMKIPIYNLKFGIGIAKGNGNNLEYAGRVNYDKARTAIWMLINPKCVGDLDTYVHESVHVVQAVETFIGIKLDDESAAYLTQWVYNTVVKKIPMIQKAEKARLKKLKLKRKQQQENND